MMRARALALLLAVGALPALAQERVPPPSATRPHLAVPPPAAPPSVAPGAPVTSGPVPGFEASPERRTLAAPPSAASPLVAAPGAVALDAETFVAKAEAELARMAELANRVSWTRATYITADTMWLDAKITAEQSTVAVAFAKEAARYDRVDVDPVTRRKLELLKHALVLPSPDRAGAAAELAELGVKIDALYSTGKVSYGGKELTLDDVEERLRVSRDPAELRALWEGWHAVARPMAADYTRLVGLANEGARQLGHGDAGVLWRSWYDMPPDDFARVVDRLWRQVAPLYRALHCYARARLNDKYGALQPRTGPLRADLLGNMWGQDWAGIYDLLAPRDASLGYDLTQALLAQKYDALRLVRTAEKFYTSIGFAELPATFWERSMFVRPRDREVECHASAWNIDDRDDLRIKMCFRVNADDFYTIHHELGHNMYQRAYKAQPALFRDGANDGFHEAVGDFAALNAVTPEYLRQLGLIERAPGPEADIPYLLRMAVGKIAFVPFGLLVDKWRWQVFSGATPPARYNEDWWALKREYQGIVPPGPRPADAFDPGAKSHVASNTPYMRYFLASIYQFQFYRAACRQAGWDGPLNRCSIYGNKQVGERLQAMLAMGASRPWPEALAAFTGERELDASAIVDYFAPLARWLGEQNKDETCGW
jgi:peptidyl-dipeptidase A